MCGYKEYYKRENLLTKKRNIILSLEWAIINNDVGLAEVCGIKLKAIMKRIKELDEANEQGK